MKLAADPRSPATGRAFPLADEDAVDRTTAAMDAFQTIAVPYGPQQAIATRIKVLRQRTIGQRGTPLPGLRFSQVSQAGKSFILQKTREEILRANLMCTESPNPYQVLYLGLEVRITVKMMCSALLQKLGDPYSHKGNSDEVKLRTKEFMEHRGVELLIIDEVQHLASDTMHNADVTDEIKRFLDAGIVPVVMAGNEASRPFFERNPQLASRLGTPLELSPVEATKTGQLSAFKTFCADLDEAMLAAGCVRKRSGLSQPEQLSGLLAASGGHIGRVCRIVEAALEHASLRDADLVEVYDLSFAVDTFAIPQGYVSTNPFLSS